MQHESLLPLLLDVVSQPPLEMQQLAAMHAAAGMPQPMQPPMTRAQAAGRPCTGGPANSQAAPFADPHAAPRQCPSTSAQQRTQQQLPGSCPSQLRLLLVPHDAGSRKHVAQLGQAINVSIPITKDSKTLQSVSKHYTAKWAAPGQAAAQLRFHAPSSQAGGHLKGTCWGPDIGKGVTMQFLRTVLGAHDSITLEYEIVTSATALQRGASVPLPLSQEQDTEGQKQQRKRQQAQRRPQELSQQQQQQQQQGAAVSGDLRAGLEKMLQLLGGACDTRDAAGLAAGPGASQRGASQEKGEHEAGPGPGSSCQTQSHSQQCSDKAHPWQWRLQQSTQQQQHSQHPEPVSVHRGVPDPALSPGSIAMPSSTVGTACGSTDGITALKAEGQCRSVGQGSGRRGGRAAGAGGRGGRGMGCGATEAESMFSSSLFGAEDEAQQPSQQLQQPQQPHNATDAPDAMAWQPAQPSGSGHAQLHGSSKEAQGVAGSGCDGAGPAGLGGVQGLAHGADADMPGTQASAAAQLPDPFLQPRGPAFREGVTAGAGAAIAFGLGQTQGLAQAGALVALPPAADMAQDASTPTKGPSRGLTPVDPAMFDVIAGLGETSCDLLDLCISPQPWRGRMPNPEAQHWLGHGAAGSIPNPDPQPWADADPACTPGQGSQAWLNPSGGLAVHAGMDGVFSFGRPAVVQAASAAQQQQQSQSQQQPQQPQQLVAGAAQALLKPRTWRLHASPSGGPQGNRPYRIARVKPAHNQQQVQQVQQALAGSWCPMLPSAGDMACVDERPAAASGAAASAMPGMVDTALHQHMGFSDQQVPAASGQLPQTAHPATGTTAPQPHASQRPQQQQQQQQQLSAMAAGQAHLHIPAGGLNANRALDTHVTAMAIDGLFSPGPMGFQQGRGSACAMPTSWTQPCSHAPAHAPAHMEMSPIPGVGRHKDMAGQGQSSLGTGAQAVPGPKVTSNPFRLCQGNGPGHGVGGEAPQALQETCIAPPSGQEQEEQETTRPEQGTNAQPKSKGSKALKQGTLRSTHPMLAVKFSRAQGQPSSVTALPGSQGPWPSQASGAQLQVWPHAAGWLGQARLEQQALSSDQKGAPKSAGKRKTRTRQGAGSSGASGRRGMGSKASDGSAGGVSTPAGKSVSQGVSSGSQREPLSWGSLSPDGTQGSAASQELQQQRGAPAAAAVMADVLVTPGPLAAAAGGKRSSAGVVPGAVAQSQKQRGVKAAKRNAHTSPGSLLQDRGHAEAVDGSPEGPVRSATAGGARLASERMAGAQAAAPACEQQRQQPTTRPALPVGGGVGPGVRPRLKDVPLPFFMKSSRGAQRGSTPPASSGRTGSAAGIARSASLPCPAAVADGLTTGTPSAAAAAAAAVAGFAPGATQVGSGAANQIEAAQAAPAAAATGASGLATGQLPFPLHSVPPMPPPDAELTKLFAMGDSWLGLEASRNPFGESRNPFGESRNPFGGAWSLSCLDGPSGLGASLLPALPGQTQQQQQQLDGSATGAAGPTEFSSLLLQRLAVASSAPTAAAAAAAPAAPSLPSDGGPLPALAGTASLASLGYTLGRPAPSASARVQGSAGQLKALGSLPLPPALQLPPLPPQQQAQAANVQLLSSIFDELSNAMSGSLSLEGPEPTQQQQQQQLGLKSLPNASSVAGAPMGGAGGLALAMMPQGLATAAGGTGQGPTAGGLAPALPSGLTMGGMDSLWGMLADASQWQLPGVPAAGQTCVNGQGPLVGAGVGSCELPKMNMERPFAALFRQ